MRGGMRNAMPEQPADVRNKNFQEVALGYTKEMAVDEAQRCLNCPKPRCVGSCPVNIDIPKFIHEVAQENFAEAYKILKQKSTLPAVCGRVCPQETSARANVCWVSRASLSLSAAWSALLLTMRVSMVWITMWKLRQNAKARRLP